MTRRWRPRAGDDVVGHAVQMTGLVRFRKERRVVYYLLTNGFSAPLLHDYGLIPGQLAPRRRGHGQR